MHHNLIVQVLQLEVHVCDPGLPTCTCNTSRSERKQLCIPNPHQTVHFNVCICMYVVVCDIIHFVGYRPPTKHTCSSLSKRSNSKCRRANQTSPNQTYGPSTHGSSHRRQAAATPSRSNTLDYPLLTQLPIPLPSDSAQNQVTFVPHEPLN